MKPSKFVIQRFLNRNRSVSWSVVGYLHGVRIRKNYKSREEAAAEKAALEIQADQGASGMRSLLTRLTPEQASEAEAVFRRLEGRPRSLEFYVDFALAQYREPAREKLVTDAVADYLELRKGDCVQGTLCHRQFRSMDASSGPFPSDSTISPSPNQLPLH